ncbi:uncharacterized protein [Venturia canescens]|uniref:uncharacterized protein isoform X1 n=1 Tax=Venturia canescens TaxID=32260 RepID=UPI001C9D60E4|nr:uncharacterized protein LOC122408786 isoform X1 [Venturia canescens]
MNEFSKTIPAKRRRRQLFQARQRTNNSAENKEGITYSSGCGLSAIVDVDDCVPLRDEVIPNGSTFIYFDLETTGLNKSSEIIQISAKRGSDEFNEYILPSNDISRAASIITGLTVEGGELHLHGQQLATVPRRIAMQRFLNFLMPGPVILVAHNGHRFDTPKLLGEVQNLGFLSELQKIVYGFCDSLPALRKKLPERVKLKQSFRLSTLAEDLIGEPASTGSHNGAVDVRMLEEIVRVSGITNEELRAETKTINTIFFAEAQTAKIKLNKSSFECITEGISMGMKTKMAKAGLSIEHLKKSFSEGGEEAIKVLLASDVSGCPRVTKNKKVIENIATQIKKLFDKP